MPSNHRSSQVPAGFVSLVALETNERPDKNSNFVRLQLESQSGIKTNVKSGNQRTERRKTACLRKTNATQFTADEGQIFVQKAFGYTPLLDFNFQIYLSRRKFFHECFNLHINIDAQNMGYTVKS